MPDARLFRDRDRERERERESCNVICKADAPREPPEKAKWKPKDALLYAPGGELW